MTNQAKHKLLADLRKEMPAPGFLSSYLAWMRTENPEGADLLEADLAEIFSDEKGLRVLKLMEKSILNRVEKLGASDSALREINAVRNFVAEIRRYVAHG